jgi:fermentation-respiration switch protein FrsA (DUF1100 family)
MQFWRSRKFRRLALFGVGLSLFFACALIFFYSWQTAHVLTHKPRTTINHTPADFGASEWREVGFTTDDGLTLKGWFIPPDPAADGATILFVHGHGGSRLDYQNIAPLFLREGYGLLLFDLRASGESEGDVVTLGCLEVLDVEAAFNFLLHQPEVDPERIALYGHSMGGATAIQAMYELPRARVLIASAAYTSVYTSVGDGIERLTPLPAFPIANLIVAMMHIKTDCNIFDVRPVETIAKIDRPLLIIQGTLDGTIELHNAHELFDAANDPKEIYIVDGAGHADIYETDPAEYERRVLGFLDTYLRDAPE